MRKGTPKIIALISILSLSMTGCANVGALTPEQEAKYSDMSTAYNKMNYNIDLSAYRTTVEYIISNSAMISGDIADDCVKYPLIADSAVTQMFASAVDAENTLGLYDVTSEDYLNQNGLIDESLSLGIDSFLEGDQLSDGEAINNALNGSDEENTEESETYDSENGEEQSVEDEAQTEEGSAEVKPSRASESEFKHSVGSKDTLEEEEETPPKYMPSVPPEKEYMNEEENQKESEERTKKDLEAYNKLKESGEETSAPEKEETDILDSIADGTEDSLIDGLEGPETTRNTEDLEIDVNTTEESAKVVDETVSKGHYPIYDENLYVVDYGSKEQSTASYEAFLNKPINTLLSIEGYKNTLVVKAESKLASRFMLRLTLDDSGKIIKISKYF